MTGNQRELTNETLLAVLQERVSNLQSGLNARLDSIRIDISELDNNMKALEVRERERNGQIAILNAANKLATQERDQDRKENAQQWKEHHVWAEGEESSFDIRLKTLEGQGHDSGVRWRFLKSQWAALVAGVAFAGSVSYLLHVIGWF